jgi:hypothetical protein
MRRVKAQRMRFLALCVLVGCVPNSGDGSDGGTTQPPDASMTACVGETDAQLCYVQAAHCGRLSVVDSCNVTRSVSCGVCTGGLSCGGGGVPYRCGMCAAESDAAFCSRLGANCGELSGSDNCGNPRTVFDCGNCSGRDVCNGNQCGCLGEIDAVLCSENGAACGSLTAVDGCGVSRTVASCGGCTGGNTCTNGVCGCAAESDASFCARLGAACGALSNTDLCGNWRYVTSCGTCTGITTCGGAGTAHQCGCAAETDAAFCTRLGKNCGSVSAADNCGAMRTASCGSCSLGTTCGGSGTANVCGCIAESGAQLCSKYGNNCGTLKVADSCGTARSVACGSCSAGQMCGANGLVGQCGTTSSFSSTQTSKHAVPIAPQLINSDIFAVRASGPGEVWLATLFNLVRIKAGSAQPYFIDGLDFSGPSLTGYPLLWSSSSSDVWAGGGPSLYHFNGSGWSSVDTGMTSGSNLVAITGSASDDVWVASADEIRHFDGKSWSTWSVPSGAGSITDVIAASRGTPWITDGTNVYRWNGLSYATLPALGGSFIKRLWLSSTGTLYVVESGCTFGDAYSTVSRYDGSTWTALFSGSGTQCMNTTGTITGLGDNDIWVGDAGGGGHHWTGVATPASGYLMTTDGTAVYGADATHLYQESLGAGVVKFDAGATGFCSRAFADSGGGVWLQCQGELGRYDTTGFSLAAAVTGSTSAIVAMFASPTTSLWLALDSGAIQQRTASGTTTFNNYLGSKIAAISGNSDSNIWAVTNEGGAAHYDGKSWSTSIVPISASDTMLGIEVSTSTVWAWTSSALYQWNGTTWVAVTIPSSLQLDNVVVYNDIPWLQAEWVSTFDRYYNFYSRSGTSWKLQRSDFTGAGISSLTGLGPQGVVTLTASSGLLERWQDSGPTTLTSLVDLRIPGGERCIVMPSNNSVVFADNLRTYLARF